MNYLDLEKYFTEGRLEELLNLYQSDFETVDEFSKQFVNNLLISGVECQEALDTLTGLYMKLNIVYSIADFFYVKKKELSKVNKDLATAAITFLRIRTIFKTYLTNCRKSISTCQSQLKYHLEEMKLTK